MAHLIARGAVVDLPTACHLGDIGRVRELPRIDPSPANTIGELEHGAPKRLPDDPSWTPLA
jgi:hypothetical protein